MIYGRGRGGRFLSRAEAQRRNAIMHVHRMRARADRRDTAILILACAFIAFAAWAFENPALFAMFKTWSIAHVH